VGRGTGQGLALAKAVVAQHGGHLGFETAPGHGTTFTIRLPLAPPPPAGAAPADATADGGLFATDEAGDWEQPSDANDVDDTDLDLDLGVATVGTIG
jgi:hypothetical protein